LDDYSCGNICNWVNDSDNCRFVFNVTEVDWNGNITIDRNQRCVLPLRNDLNINCNIGSHNNNSVLSSLVFNDDDFGFFSVRLNNYHRCYVSNVITSISLWANVALSILAFVVFTANCDSRIRGRVSLNRN